VIFSLVISQISEVIFMLDLKKIRRREERSKSVSLHSSLGHIYEDFEAIASSSKSNTSIPTHIVFFGPFLSG
jgi:hypothetical protein